MDISKKATNIHNVSKGLPAFADPRTDMRIVAEGETGGLFIAPTEKTRGLVDPDAPDAAELRALYADPDGVFGSGTERAIHYLSMMRTALTEGQITQPSVVTLAGDPQHYVEHGRTRLVVWAILWEALDGTREVKAIAGLIDEKRRAFGMHWRPDFKVINGGAGLKNTDHLRASVMIENTGRKTIGERGRYALAIDTIEKWEHLHRADAKAPPPPYETIAATAGRSVGEVRSWRKLSKQTSFVVEAVMRFYDGSDGGVSLNFVMQLVKSDTTPEEVERLVREAIETGATSVSDARATRRAMTGGYDDSDDENGSDEEPDGDEEPTERSARPAVKFSDKPLGVVFVKSYAAAIDGNGNEGETLALACMKLVTLGWSSLTKKERAAIDGDGKHKKGVTTLSGAIEDARKAAAAKAKKRAEKAAKAAAAEAPAEAPSAEAPAGE